VPPQRRVQHTVERGAVDGAPEAVAEGAVGLRGEGRDVSD